MSWKFWLKTVYFFYLFGPISQALWGCIRAKRFGIMEDLPTPVLKEWRDWCEKRDYFFDSKFAEKTVPTARYSNLPFPIHVFWASDDEISNEANTTQFWSHIKSSQGITFRKVTPEELQVSSIDHFGFFKKRFRDTLWEEALAQLEEYYKKTQTDVIAS